jgi:tRNA modification GTPase
LFNALVGTGRAIVTDVPGTTRDLVTETIDLFGLQATLVDTAGLRESENSIEREGIARARQAMVVSDVILLLVEGAAAWSSEDEECLQLFDNKTVIVQSKADETAIWNRAEQIAVSVLTGAGIEHLKTRILAVVGALPERDVPAVTNIRHVELLQRARSAALAARLAVVAEFESGRTLSEEFVLADLQTAREALEAVTGRRSADDVLAYVFSRFCVGK